MDAISIGLRDYYSFYFREREDHEKYLQRIEEEMDSQVQKVEATVREQAREEVEAERRALKSQMDAEMDELQTHLKLFQKVAHFSFWSCATNSLAHWPFILFLNSNCVLNLVGG